MNVSTNAGSKNTIYQFWAAAREDGGASTFAAQGQRVAVIERKDIGGSWPSIACLTSMKISPSAKIGSCVQRGGSTKSK